jgi:glycosyltransferase involved in cell wall biosynthesis
MRVLHISQSDSGNGAGAAAHRLHRAFGGVGIESRMLAGLRNSGDKSVQQGGGNVLTRRLMPYLNARIVRVLGGRGLLSPGIFVYGRIPRESVEWADAIVLHWITGGFIAPRQLTGIGKPIFWRLSDIWAFSGGCHYPGACTRYEANCGACPMMRGRPEHDLSRREWQAKQRAYSELDLTIVAPSRWIAECAQRSGLLRGRRIVHIPTGVDADRFRPSSAEAARQRFGLPLDRQIILFGALRATDDPRKGFAYLQLALHRLAALPDARNWDLVVFGGPSSPPKSAGLPANMKCTWLGRINDEATLASLFAATDVLVASFLEDNLPNIVIEAMSCALPVVAFAVGGLPDLVEHQRSGWLAPVRDAVALADGIAWVLADEERRRGLGAAARRRIEHTHTLKRCAREWRDLLRASHQTRTESTELRFVQ